MKLPGWIAAAVLYFLIVFVAGFLLGTLRVLVLESEMGRENAVLAELPIMLAISFLVCRLLIAKFDVPARVVARLAMGGLAFTLLVAAEIALAVAIGGQPFADAASMLFAKENFPGLAGQAIFGLLPPLLLVSKRPLSR